MLNAENKTFNIPIEIKKIIAEKRKARATWHRTHAPADKTKLNRITNQLKTKIKEAQDRSFSDYLTHLNQFDNSIWKPIKHLKKPTMQVPPIRNEMDPNLQWARTDGEKPYYL